MSRPVLKAGLSLGLATVGVALAFVASASASVASVELRGLSSPLTSANKSTLVACPEGKQVIAAAGQTSGAEGQVVLHSIRPNAALTDVTVQGLEDQNGAAETWFVTARAVCAVPPPGLQRIRSESVTNSAASKSVTASCPAGKKLIGTGGEIAGGSGQVALDDILPLSGLTGVTVQGLEDQDGTSATWSVVAFAICASPVTGAHRVMATSPNNSQTSRTVTASCPNGEDVIGVGGDLGGPPGRVITMMAPNADLDMVTVTGWEDENGTNTNWFARAFAICAPTWERVVENGGPASSFDTQTAVCPTAKQPVGAGADITGGGGRVVIGSLSFQGDTVTSSVYEISPADGWFMRAYAICGRPLPNRQVVEVISAQNSDAPKSVTATCPAGKRVVGTGAHIGGSVSGVILNGFAPNTALTSVTAKGVEREGGWSMNWNVNAIAVCAPAPLGLELVTAKGTDDSDPQSVTATCPAGKTLLGTGAELSDGANGEVTLDDVRPDALLTSTTVTAFEDATGTPNIWRPVAYAICGNP